MKGKFVDIKQLNAAKELLYKAAAYAGIKFDPEELASCNWLSDKMLAEMDVTSSGQRIRDFYKIDPANYTSNSFRLNKVKDGLAAFVLLREGIIKKSDIQFIESKRKGKEKSIKTIYFLLYYARVAPNTESEEIEISSNILTKESRYNLPLIQNTIPSYLVGSTWRFYNFDEDGTIYGHILKISAEQNGNLSRCEIINADKDYQDYEGWVGMDNTLTYLIFNFVNKKTYQKSAQMMCKVVIGSSPNIILGIITFISSLKSRLNAAIILLEKQNSDTEGKTIIDSIDSPVPNEVKRLFAFYNMRLLVLPDKAVINFEDLNKWLDKEEKIGKSVLPNDEILLSYCQEYMIYYMWEDYSGQKQISKARLEIYLSPTSNQITGKLEISERDKYDNGIVNRNNSFISAFFVKEFPSGANTRTTYLVFKIGEEFIPDGMECFLGIVTGVSERHESAIGLLALFVPKTFREIESEWLIKYFSSKEWRIETYDHKGFNFDNL